MQSINLRVNLPGPAATITVEVLVPADVEWLGDKVGHGRAVVHIGRAVEEMERAIGEDSVMKVVAGCSVDIGDVLEELLPDVASEGRDREAVPVNGWAVEAGEPGLAVEREGRVHHACDVAGAEQHVGGVVLVVGGVVHGGRAGLAQRRHPASSRGIPRAVTGCMGDSVRGNVSG